MIRINKKQLVNTVLLQISIIIIFSFIYYFIGEDNFIFNINNLNVKVTNYLEYLYFSIGTSSSTGFGDIVPITQLARTLVILQIFITYTTILRLIFVYK